MRKKLSENSHKIRVAWIPERYAKIGKYIKLKIENDVLEDGWEVISADSKTKAEEIELCSRDYLKQRKASDV